MCYSRISKRRNIFQRYSNYLKIGITNILRTSDFLKHKKEKFSTSSKFFINKNKLKSDFQSTKPYRLNNDDKKIKENINLIDKSKETLYSIDNKLIIDN